MMVSLAPKAKLIELNLLKFNSYNGQFENVDLGQCNRIFYHIKISKIAKFGWQMLKNTENIASQSLRILYIFILRTEKVTTFEAKLERKW